MAYFGTVVRFALTVVALMLIGYVFSGFHHMTFGDAALLALVIGALGYGNPDLLPAQDAQERSRDHRFRRGGRRDLARAVRRATVARVAAHGAVCRSFDWPRQLRGARRDRLR